MSKDDSHETEGMRLTSSLLPVFPDAIDESSGASKRVSELVEAVFTADEWGEPIYRAAAHSLDPSLRIDVAYALGVVGATAPFAHDLLSTLVSDRDSDVRAVASYCLASLDVSV
jgi:hypothetical protein